MYKKTLIILFSVICLCHADVFAKTPVVKMSDLLGWENLTGRMLADQVLFMKDIKTPAVLKTVPIEQVKEIWPETTKNYVEMDSIGSCRVYGGTFFSFDEMLADITPGASWITSQDKYGILDVELVMMGTVGIGVHAARSFGAPHKIYIFCPGLNFDTPATEFSKATNNSLVFLQTFLNSLTMD